MENFKNRRSTSLYRVKRECISVEVTSHLKAKDEEPDMKRARENHSRQREESVQRPGYRKDFGVYKKGTRLSV